MIWSRRKDGWIGGNASDASDASERLGESIKGDKETEVSDHQHCIAVAKLDVRHQHKHKRLYTTCRRGRHEHQSHHHYPYIALPFFRQLCDLGGDHVPV